MEDLSEIFGDVATGDISVAFSPEALNDLQRLKPSERAEFVEALKDMAADPYGPKMKRLKPVADWPRVPD